jgi:hypothetical protein
MLEELPSEDGLFKSDDGEEKDFGRSHLFFSILRLN